MQGMFSDCSSLTKHNVSKFDTSNVVDMAGLFQNCSELTSLNISSFNTGNVETMEAMFYNCPKLNSIMLGKKFKFVGDDASLTSPPTDNGWTGKWIRKEGGITPKTTEELVSLYGANADEWAGTWIWQTT